MLKKTITFKDLDEKPITKDFYFSLTKAQLVRKNLRAMTLDDNGEADVEAFKAQIMSIINSKRGSDIMDAFEDIIREAYGERDPDGITFHRGPELSQRFMSTDAYDVLFLELVTNAGAAAEFINAIMPKDLDTLGAEPVKEDKHIAFPEASTPKTPLGLPVNQDLANMSKEELIAALQSK